MNKLKTNLGRLGTLLLILGVVSGGTSGAMVSGASRQVVAIDPKVAGLVKQARSELKLGQYDAAIRTLSVALQMKPDTKTASAIHSWRAGAYTHRGEFDNAISDANESVRLNPGYFGGYLERAILYRRNGNLDQGISYYNTAIRLNPNFARSYYDRANAYAVKGDYNEAMRDYGEAIRRQDPSMEADFYYNRAVLYHLMGTLDKAMADFNKAIRLAPKDLTNYSGRASAFEDMGQLDKASADYDQVIRFNATDAPGYRMRGSAFFAKGNYRAAASDFKNAVRLSPSDYDCLNSLAWFQATCPDDSLRNGKEALEKCKHACEMSRWEDSGTVDTLAAAYAELGDFDNAVKYETQAINMKGVYAFKRKRMQERLDLYRKHEPYRKESKFKPH